ncbi:pyridoxamine 5'-phosphate oxidase family protein [Jatrophihabitans sp. DSM 45814]
MKVHETITDRLHKWIMVQPMFFVGTAPSGADGHLNISPKGMPGSFAILDPLRVAYLDYTGSGAETAAHLRDNGRIVLMFCAFQGPPQIVRLHGRGRAVLPDDADFADLRSAFGRDGDHAIRSIIDVAVTRVSDSCGYTVPLMQFQSDRQLLDQWSDRKTPEELADYWANRNATSIDGLPSIGSR